MTSVENEASLQNSEPEPRRPRLVQADPALRAKLLILLLLLLVISAASLWMTPAGEKLLFEAFSDNKPVEATQVLLVCYSLVSICAISLIIAGIEVIRSSWKIHRERVYPAPGMKVLVDTWVVRGRRAIFLSYLGISLGSMLIMAGCSVPFLFHRLFLQLLSPALIHL